MTPQDLPNQDHPMQDRVQQAIAYFRQGYNCSQSVAMAFADLYGIEPETMARLAASFGGGIGRMRQTCGAACGLFMLAGLEKCAIEGKDIHVWVDETRPRLQGARLTAWELHKAGRFVFLFIKS